MLVSYTDFLPCPKLLHLLMHFFKGLIFKQSFNEGLLCARYYTQWFMQIITFNSQNYSGEKFNWTCYKAFLDVEPTQNWQLKPGIFYFKIQQTPPSIVPFFVLGHRKHNNLSSLSKNILTFHTYWTFRNITCVAGLWNFSGLASTLWHSRVLQGI